MTRLMPRTERVPYALYRAAQVQALDRRAIEQYGIPGAVLMERAGAAAYRLLRDKWTGAMDVTVVCGVGNNGGDGYVLARLAIEAGLRVRVLQLGDPAKLAGAALDKANAYRDAGGEVLELGGFPRHTDVIVDAVLGTGLERAVTGAWAEALSRMNRNAAPTLAIDIPSGLHADTGRVLGVAVAATATIGFIGLKQGMFTGSGPDCCGEVHFDALDVPARIYATEIAAARRMDWARLADLLGPRRRSAHKGDFGHVLVVGGAPGYAGAARMAGEAAARCGAGLVSVATHPHHAAMLVAACPELMGHGVEGKRALRPLLERATVVAVGPGIGRSDWSVALFEAVLEAGLPLVVDADALGLLAAQPRKRDDWVLTPHPGEAARLLGTSVQVVQQDRFASVRALQRQYGGTAVLKGSGTLLYGASDRPPAVCSAGNPGMASGGMGDLLTGIVAGLIAQGLAPEDAACGGVCLHAAAGDRAARRGGERGMLATDLLPWVRRLINQAPPRVDA